MSREGVVSANGDDVPEGSFSPSSTVDLNGISSLASEDSRILCNVLGWRVLPDLVEAHPIPVPLTSERKKIDLWHSELQTIRPNLKSAILERRLDLAADVVGRLLERRTPVQVIYLDLLARMAGEFGEMWEEDSLDFFSVTEALGVLQSLFHQVSGHSLPKASPNGAERRIIIARAPGDQHLFGAITLREFFHLDAWDVVGGLELEVDDELIALVGQQWISIVGISLSTKDGIRRLPDVITEIRSRSKNDRIGILVGGPAFNEDSSLFQLVGADAMAREANEALVVAEKLRAVSI